MLIICFIVITVILLVVIGLQALRIDELKAAEEYYLSRICALAEDQ
jgi:hypothetical protein